MQDSATLRVVHAFLTILLLAFPSYVFAQLDDAKAAIERGQYVQAVEILSEAIRRQPTADAYLLLGGAYGRMREWQKAEETLRTGAQRFPDDIRFHNELANLFLAANEPDKARAALNESLAADPFNSFASDTLAALDMSEGNVRSALRAWNRVGRPVVQDVLYNSFAAPAHWTIPAARAFHPDAVLTYGQWRTTETRLLETRLFSTAGIDLEPSTVADRYNVNIRTTPKTNSFANRLFDLLKGAPIQTSYLNQWNAAGSGINLNSMYRWQADRRRAELAVRAPTPLLPGLLFVDGIGLWRSENWDLSPILQSDGSMNRFRFKSTGAQIMLKHIPHYRFEIGAGFDYENRSAAGAAPNLPLDNANVGKILFEASLLMTDNRYRSRLHAEGFAGRAFVFGNVDYRAGTVEMNNRLTLSQDYESYLSWTVKAGTSRGPLPVEDYFVVGVDTYPPHNLLRAHRAFRDGSYGNAPLGTDFALVNLDLERQFAILPFFNTFNLPYVRIKGLVFLDGAKTWDRQNFFTEGEFLVDAGVGLKLETPTHAVNLVYGRSLREGTGAATLYIEKRW